MLSNSRKTKGHFIKPMLLVRTDKLPDELSHWFMK